MARCPSPCELYVRVAENRSIWVWDWCGTVRGEAIGNGLGVGIIAGVYAELPTNIPMY